jgi:hypothetical protein
MAAASASTGKRLYDFEQVLWRRGEADSHPFDRDIYPPENGKYWPLAPPSTRLQLGAPRWPGSGVHQSERLSVVFCSIPSRTPVERTGSGR